MWGKQGRPKGGNNLTPGLDPGVCDKVRMSSLSPPPPPPLYCPGDGDPETQLMSPAPIFQTRLGRTCLESYPWAPTSFLALALELRTSLSDVDSDSLCPLLCVHLLLVLCEVDVLAEGFPTLATLAGLLFRLDPLVDGEQEVPDRNLMPLSAHVGFLGCVDVLELDEVGAQAEGLEAWATL